jgi:hypothetical protein
MSRLLALNETSLLSPQESSNGLAESLGDRMEVDSMDERMSIVKSDYGTQPSLKVETSNSGMEKMSISAEVEDGEPQLSSAEVARNLAVFRHVQSVMEAALRQWDEAHPIKIRSCLNEDDIYIDLADEDFENLIFGRRADAPGYIMGGISLTKQREIVQIGQLRKKLFATAIGELYDWNDDDKGLYFALDGNVYCSSLRHGSPSCKDGWYHVAVDYSFRLESIFPNDILADISEYEKEE